MMSSIYRTQRVVSNLERQWQHFSARFYSFQALDYRDSDKRNEILLDDEIALLERSSEIPAVETLSSVLQRCRNKKNPKFAKRLQDYIVKNQLQDHKVIGNYLVSMLAGCGCVQDAEEVLHSLSDKNHYSWNALILSYIERDRLQDVFHLYEKMQESEVQPTTYTFVALLKACTKLKDIQRGRQVRDDAVQIGFKDDIFISNALIDMFGKCGSLPEAEDVFKKLSAPDVVSWSSMISAYMSNRHYIDALDCFQRMKEAGEAPNSVAYVCCLKAVSSVGCIERGRLVYNEVIKKGIETDTLVRNTAVDMFCKCNCLIEANVVSGNRNARDIVTWNVLMAGYMEHGQHSEVLHFFEKLQSEGLTPDDVTFMWSLKACASLSDINVGLSIHAAIVFAGLEQNIILGNTLVDMFSKCGWVGEARQVFDKLQFQDRVSWSSLMTAYAQHGPCIEAVNCLPKMRLKGVSPDSVILACGLKACCSMGAKQKGLTIHSEVTKFGFEKDVYIGTILIDMYGEFGMILDSKKVFDELPCQNITAWSAMVKAYGINHEGEKAVQCFQEMQNKGIKADAIALTTILVACSHTSLVLKGQRYFQQLGETQRQNVFHLSSMVDLLARSGSVNDAERVLDTVQCTPTKETWKALLSACKIYGEMELGLRCFDQLLEMNADDASVYVIMAEIYRNAGRWDEAVKLENIRKSKQVKKTPGKALIEINKTIHEFVVADKLSQRVNKIFKLLRVRMKGMGYIPDMSPDR